MDTIIIPGKLADDMGSNKLHELAQLAAGRTGKVRLLIEGHSDYHGDRQYTAQGPGVPPPPPYFDYKVKAEITFTVTAQSASDAMQMAEEKLRDEHFVEGYTTVIVGQAEGK